MNIDATAEITKFDLPPIPRFLCAYVGDEWVIVARDTEACKKHFAERLEWLQSSKRPHAIVTVNATPPNDAGEAQRLREALQHAREQVFCWANPQNVYPKYWLELVRQIDAALEGKA